VPERLAVAITGAEITRYVFPEVSAPKLEKPSPKRSKPRPEVPKNSQGREQAVWPAKPDYNLLDFGALENEKELPL